MAKRAALVVLAAVALGPMSARAQGEPVATRTKAGRGLVLGAGIGSGLLGLSFGVFSAGLCDAADCDGSFMEGFWTGVVVGAAGGGLTGLVVGSAIPGDGRAVGGWSWTMRVGVRGASADAASGLAPVVEVRALRAVTDRMLFGVMVEDLGGTTARETSRFRGTGGIASMAELTIGVRHGR